MNLIGLITLAQEAPELPDNAAQQSGDAAAAAIAAMAGVVGLVALVVGLIVVIALWKMFSKAGEPGWAAIVPIYNYIVWLKITGRPLWWIVLWLFVSPIMWIIGSLDLAKAFGKGGGFGVGIMFFPFIFLPILGFGSAQYVGTKTV